MLPIDTILPDLIETLKHNRRCVLQAPPGAGKTTRVPLALREARLTSGRIVMLEPRRLAARSAAARMAQTLGEPVGAQVGFRIRGESKVSGATRIEVVTEGILTRMLQSDPELQGIGAVIFDEFHERSLNADLGLALCLEVADVLREDLIIVAMSATLDAEPVAQIMQAPILTSEGRAFPVDLRYLDRPLPPAQRFETGMADLIRTAITEAQGSLLAFLPGEGEIRRMQSLLTGTLPADCEITPLYGSMPFKAQQEAIAPATTGNRKVVLSTAIAETSLTLPDIRIVVDGGRARRAVFDPGSGMSRLVTEKVTRAEATQRAGRAGRVAPGTCWRMWTRGEDGALAAYPAPEITAGDLTAFALELALWAADADALRFVTPPHAGRLAEARGLLRILGALDERDRITAHGKALAATPLHPRLAHMLETAGRAAAPLAALLADRDPLRGAGTDLTARLRALDAPAGRADPSARGALERIRTEAKRLARGRPDKAALDVGAMAALAYPDRVALRRKGDAPRYLLANGKGAILPEGDPLAGFPLIVATDLDGHPREARVRLAAAVTESDIRALFADQIQQVDTCTWSRRDNRVLTRRQDRFEALVLDDNPWTNAPDTEIAQAMLDGVRQMGLGPSGPARLFLARARLMRSDFPDFSDAHLMETLEDWLLPYLGGVRSASDWKGFDLRTALEARLDWTMRARLDSEAPAHFETPLGRRVAIDYGGEHPAIAVRLQEMFGVSAHPLVAGRPLQITLLSPAGRPVQVTQDLPGFWQSSYADVRKDMRGRYPKHPWPEDPTAANPTLKTKRRAP